MNGFALASIWILVILVAIGLIILTVFLCHCFLKNLNSKDRKTSFKHSFSLFQNKGKAGENWIAKLIGGEIEGQRYVYSNLYVKGKSGTSEIDFVILQHNGIFVLEVKNWAGTIYGNEEDQYWIQILGNGNVRNQHYNPLLQNKTHVYRLKEKLGKTAPIIPAVIFVDGDISSLQAQGVYRAEDLQNLMVSNTGYSLSEWQLKNYKTILDQQIRYKNELQKEHEKEQKERKERYGK